MLDYWSLIASSLRYLLLLVVGFVVVTNTIVCGWTIKKGSSRKVRRVLVGLPFLNGLYFSHFEYENYRVSLGAVILRAFRGYSIELRDITVKCNSFVSQPKQTPQVLQLKLSLSHTLLVVLRYLGPKKIIVKNATLVWPHSGLRLQLATGDVRISFANGLTKPYLSFNASGIQDNKHIVKIRAIHYDINITLQDSEQGSNTGRRMRLARHDHSLVLIGARLHVNERPPMANHSHAPSAEDSPKDEADWTAKKENILRVLSSLGSIDARFENLSIAVGPSFHISIPSMYLSQKVTDYTEHTALELFSNLRNEPIHEVLFTINSTTLSLDDEAFLKLPSVTVNSVFNLISAVMNPEKTYPTVACTLAAVDPSILLTQEQLVKLWEYTIPGADDAYVRPHGSAKSRKWTEVFGLDVYPEFVTKIIVSNLSFTLKLSSTKHFVFRTTNVHSLGQNRRAFETGSEGIKSSADDLRDTRDHTDNFLKIDKFSLTFYSFGGDDSTHAYELPVVVFSKWEFFGESIISNEIIITSTLRNLKISVEDVEVIKGVGQYVGEWTTRIKSQKMRRAKGRELGFSLKLRLKNAVASLMVSDYLPTILDKSGSCRNLAHYTRGSSIILQEAFMDFCSNGQKLHVIKGTIEKMMEDNGAPYSKSPIMSVKDFVLERRQEKFRFIIPSCSVSFDINTVWLFFYLRDIAHGLFESKTPKSPIESQSSHFELPKFFRLIDADVVSLLINIELPHSIKLKLAIESGSLAGNSMTLNMGSLQIFTTTVYQSNDTFVPILRMHKAFMKMNKASHEEMPFEIKTETTWVKFEYHLRLYKILDNISTMIKCIKALSGYFGDYFNIMAREPQVEDAKCVPPIHFETGILTLDVEEDPFEQELGLIYKVGVTEQLERIEKLRLMEQELSPTLNHDSVAHLGREDKLQRLFEQFSISWINRMKKARLRFFGRPFTKINRLDIGTSSFKVFEGLNSTILKVELEDVHLRLHRPSFPLQNCDEFFYKYGKKMPRNTKFTTLIPLGVELSGTRCEFILRDYPLPIAFFPDMSIKGDLVFAERMPCPLSKRYVHVPFVPGATGELYTSTNSIYGSNIVRTLNPLKAYMNLKCEVESDKPTTVTWGKSLQPGFQAVMIWFDYLSKPPVDPSEKLGFWDKFRLLIHGQLILEWRGNSEFHLNLKGSHDPYLVTDKGAGLSFCWRGDARLSLHESSDPTEFLKITSNQFLLAIRDFTHQRRLEKTLMELSGYVTWTMGISFEAGNPKDPGSVKRSSTFQPHYKINLCNPRFLDPSVVHDSYEGFRSDFIHLFFQVKNGTSVKSSNNVHLAPYCMTHFFSWWNLFSTYTSGPIRQGPLFPDLLQNPKKFSKALFTVKYSLQVSPLMLCHTYIHADSQLSNSDSDETAFTSLKGSFESLTLDLHQKRVKMDHAETNLGTSRTVWKFKMNAGEIDCRTADIRMIYSQLASSREDQSQGGWQRSSSEEPDQNSTFASSQNGNSNRSWFNLEDYNDINQGMGKRFKIRVFDEAPLLYSPRISYLRELSEGESLKFPFGSESDHECALGHNDPMVTQELLARARAQELESQLSSIEKVISELTPTSKSSQQHTKVDEHLETLRARYHDFRHRLHIIHVVLEDLMLSKLPSNSLVSDDLESSASSGSDLSKSESHKALLRVNTLSSFRSMRKATSAFVKSSFDNRFILHNILLKVNNKTRDMLLDYVFNVLNRKKSSFFQTYKSVALLEELLKVKLWNLPSGRLRKEYDALLEDTLSNANLFERCEDIIRKIAEEGLEARDTLQIKFVLPQIQVTSEEVSQKCILITARDVETSIVEINQMPFSSLHNAPVDVNSLVETRFATKLNEAHFFIFDRGDLSSDNGLGFEMNGYGADSKSAFWPPWLPMEMCYNCEALEDSLFLERNDMIMLFTQPNSLFFQDKTNKMNRSEAKVRIGFPKLTLASNSDQYSSIYAIAVEMLHFASSFDKKADKLSRVMLAEEVRNNLDKLDVSIIVNLQKSIKNLDRTRAYLKMHDPQGYKKVAHLIATELDAAILELNLLMSAIKKNHDKLRLSGGSENHQDKLYWQIGADEVTWRLLDDQENDFVLFELGTASFYRSQALDGTNSNKITISSLSCFNLQKNAVYRKLLGPYEDTVENSKPLIEISWLIGPSVGGISDLVNLVVLLKPFTFKMDHRTSDLLLQYLFPSPSIDTASQVHTLTQDTSSSRSRPSSSGLNLNLRLRNMSSTFSSSPLVSNSRLSSPAPPSILTRRNAQDMNEMVDRSSRYFNVGLVVIEKVTMSISYRGSRSLITNVDNLTVKVPTLRYSRRLWSREEFIATLKKDIIKIVLQHTGNIIGNKLTFHKKAKELDNIESLGKLGSATSGSPQSVRFPGHVKAAQAHPNSTHLHKTQTSDRASGHGSERADDTLAELKTPTSTVSVEAFFPVTTAPDATLAEKIT
ncbi:LAFA_0D12970g1_1 [Lachancea sp. 'fantastica']|nr:LAFA_0D12970g1_1 [Lachancea sp. 'fantastica']